MPPCGEEHLLSVVLPREGSELWEDPGTLEVRRQALEGLAEHTCPIRSSSDSCQSRDTKKHHGSDFARIFGQEKGLSNNSPQKTRWG